MPTRMLLALLILVLTLAVLPAASGAPTPPETARAADGGPTSFVPAPQARKSKRPIVLVAPAKADASRVIELVAFAKRVGKRSRVHLQVKRNGTWENDFARCYFDEPGPSARWVSWMPERGSVSFRVVAVWKSKRYVSNVRTVEIVPVVDPNPAPTEPITDAQRRDAVQALASTINDDRTARGLNPLEVDWSASDGSLQNATISYYLTGEPPTRSAYPGAATLLWGTHHSQTPPALTPSAFRDPGLTQLAVGYYFDEHGAFDEKMSALVMAAR